MREIRGVRDITGEIKKNTGGREPPVSDRQD